MGTSNELSFSLSVSLLLYNCFLHNYRHGRTLVIATYLQAYTYTCMYVCVYLTPQPGTRVCRSAQQEPDKAYQLLHTPSIDAPTLRRHWDRAPLRAAPPLRLPVDCSVCMYVCVCVSECACVCVSECVCVILIWYKEEKERCRNRDI